MGRVYEMEGVGGGEMAGDSGENFGGGGGGREWMKTIEEMRHRRGSENGEESVDDREKGVEREKRAKEAEVQEGGNRK